eukprot:365689-Chlamydomonas_euryale.AAC.1
MRGRVPDAAHAPPSSSDAMGATRTPTLGGAVDAGAPNVPPACSAGCVAKSAAADAGSATRAAAMSSARGSPGGSRTTDVTMTEPDWMPVMSTCGGRRRQGLRGLETSQALKVPRPLQKNQNALPALGKPKQATASLNLGPGKPWPPCGLTLLIDTLVLSASPWRKVSRNSCSTKGSDTMSAMLTSSKVTVVFSSVLESGVAGGRGGGDGGSGGDGGD